MAITIRFKLASMQGLGITTLLAAPMVLLGVLRVLLPFEGEVDVAQLNRVYWRLFFIVIAAMNVVVYLIYVITRKHLFYPLTILSHRARGYTEGIPVLVRERFAIREIDELARSVNDLMDTVMSREDALHKLNEDLEQKVSDRTRALEDTIERLSSTREQLLLSEKMAALGSLVSGVAHEINTPMSIGVTAASFLNERTRALYGEWDRQALTQDNLERFLRDADESSRIIQTNLDHAARIISSLKQVAVDQQVDEQREFELGSYIDDILLSLRHQLKDGKHTITAHTEGLIMVSTYPGAVTQVLNNLVFNSVTHGFENREGGIVEIATRRDGEDAVISYADNGRGLSQEESDRIFEQFFTTRLGRGGTGLGMNIVQNLVMEKLGGSIELAMPETGGTGFRIRFPVNRTPRPADTGMDSGEGAT